MSFSHLPTVQRVLLALVASLSTVYLYLLLSPLPQFDIPKPVAAARNEPPAPDPAVFTPPMSLAFDEIDARPLFNPSRKPLKQPPAAGAVAAPPPPVNLSLVGIIMGPEARIAVLKTPASPVAINAGVGRMVDGWKVERIEGDRVVLSAGGASREIRLRPGPGN